jgi:hypothetical protein
VNKDLREIPVLKEKRAIRETLVKLVNLLMNFENL